MTHRLRELRNREDGNSLFILYLMMFVILLGFFGLAVDTAMLVNARTQTQATVDNSLLSATRMKFVNSNDINPETSRAEAEALYSVNRNNAPGIKCATSADLARHPGTVLRGTGGCQWMQSEYRVISGAENAAATGGRIVTSSITMTVVECAPTIFLTPIHPENCFSLTSTARLATAMENA